MKARSRSTSRTPRRKPTAEAAVVAVKQQRRPRPVAPVQAPVSAARAAAVYEAKTRPKMGAPAAYNTNTKTMRDRRPKATRRDQDEDYRQRQSMEKQVSAAAHRAVIGGKTVAPPRERRAKAPKGRQNTSSGFAKQAMRSRLSDYLRTLQNAFDSEPVKCPVNYNPVPSQLTSVASTPVELITISVAATSVTEILIWPGHGSELDTEAMDGESYHAVTQVIGVATNYSVGPLANGVQNASLGCYTTGLAAGAATTVTNAATTTNISPSVALPYQASSGNVSHTRWKLNAATVELQNTTAEGSRGGNVTYVQTNTMAPPTGQQANFSVQPTFGYSELANTETFRQSWLPRSVDQAFWHTAPVTATPDNGSQTGTWKLWLNNPTSVAQTYTFGAQFHWELGGSNLLALATPAVLQPADNDIIEPSLEVMRFAGTDTQHALKVGTAVAKGASPWVDAMMDAAGTGMKILAGSALEGMTSLFL